MDKDINTRASFLPIESLNHYIEGKIDFTVWPRCINSNLSYEQHWKYLRWFYLNIIYALLYVCLNCRITIPYNTDSHPILNRFSLTIRNNTTLMLNWEPKPAKMYTNITITDPNNFTHRINGVFIYSSSKCDILYIPQTGMPFRIVCWANRVNFAQNKYWTPHWHQNSEQVKVS